MTNGTKKVTKNDNFNAIKEILSKMEGTEALIEFINHEQELLAKKSNSKGESKMAKINAQLDENILALLQERGPLSASEIVEKVSIDNIEGLEKVTLPKINSRLSYLGKEAKQIDRIVDKKSVTFAIGTGNGFKTKAAETAKTEEQDEGE